MTPLYSKETANEVIAYLDDIDVINNNPYFFLGSAGYLLIFIRSPYRLIAQFLNIWQACQLRR